MHGVVHVDAFLPIALNREVDDVPGSRLRPYMIENVGKRDTVPFGDVRPALLARNFGDLAAGGEAFELRERKGRWAVDEAINGEAPLGEIAGLEALERGIQRGLDLVCEGGIRDLARRKFAGERVASDEAMTGIGERFAEAVNAAVVGRDEAILFHEVRGNAEAREARDGAEAGEDEFAARDVLHVRSLCTAGLPVIIARVRVQNPARKIITMWTIRKKTRAIETKK